MSHSGDDRLTVAVDLMAEPCLWRWEIRDPKRDEVVASSWTDEWMAFESPDEALCAAGVRLNSMSRYKRIAEMERLALARPTTPVSNLEPKFPVPEANWDNHSK